LDHTVYAELYYEMPIESPIVDTSRSSGKHTKVASIDGIGDTSPRIRTPKAVMTSTNEDTRRLLYTLPQHEANTPLLSVQDTAISLNNAVDQHHRGPTP